MQDAKDVPAAKPGKADLERVEPPRPPPRPTEAAARALVAERFGGYEERFATQMRDPAWAPQVEEQARSVMTGEALRGVRLQSFTCATTLCKLEAQAGSEEDLQALTRTFARGVSGLPQGSFREVDDGRGGLILQGFFAREGHNLEEAAEEGGW